MRAGACTLYDGRLLQFGQPNSKGTLGDFNVFKPGADGAMVGRRPRIPSTG